MNTWKKNLLQTSMLMAGLIAGSFSLANAQAQHQIKWTGYGVGKSHWGHVDVKSADVKMNKTSLDSLVIEADLGTISTRDLEGAMAERLNGHLKNEDFFEVTKYPTAKFTSTKVTPQKDGAFGVEGSLQIKDQTHPETIVLKKVKEGEKEFLTGTLKFDRAKYNVRYNSGKFFSVAKLGDKLVRDEVDLEIKIAL